MFLNIPVSQTPPLPDAEAIRQTAREVLQGPEYQHTALELNIAPFLKRLEEFVRWVLQPFDRLFDGIAGAANAIGWPVVVALIVLLVLLIGHITYTIVAALRGPERDRQFSPDGGAVHDPKLLERQADEAVARGDNLSAIRFLFRACLLRLARREKRTFRPGTTNREFLRQYRGSAVADPLGLFVETIDSKWYGEELCHSSDYDACRRAHAEIRRFTDLSIDGVKDA